MQKNKDKRSYLIYFDRGFWLFSMVHVHNHEDTLKGGAGGQTGSRSSTPQMLQVGATGSIRFHYRRQITAMGNLQ